MLQQCLTSAQYRSCWTTWDGRATARPSRFDQLSAATHYTGTALTRRCNKLSIRWVLTVACSTGREKAIEKNKKVYMAFVDVEIA